MACRIQKKQHPDIGDLARQCIDGADGHIEYLRSIGVPATSGRARGRAVDIMGGAVVKDGVANLADLFEVHQRFLDSRIQRFVTRLGQPTDGGDAAIDFH